jgi:methionyl-tRNA synthetase
VITGDYDSAQAVWASRPIEAGIPLAPPTPVFTKLDDSIVAEELARLEEKAQ